jgi:hypothetical protein
MFVKGILVVIILFLMMGNSKFCMMLIIALFYKLNLFSLEACVHSL